MLAFFVAHKFTFQDDCQDLKFIGELHQKRLLEKKGKRVRMTKVYSGLGQDVSQTLLAT